MEGNLSSGGYTNNGTRTKAQPAGITVTEKCYWGRAGAMSSGILIPGRSNHGEQARHRQLMTEPQPTLAGNGEILNWWQDGCG